MAAKRTIEQFRAKLAGGGARPNLFEVELNFPTSLNAQTIDGAAAKTNSQFLVKAAALPASNITPIDVPFRGRILKLAGERTFDTWTITVLNDTDFSIRTAFEQWMNGISKLDDASGEVNPEDYSQSAKVFQLDRSGDVMREYEFYGLFPTNISQIDLSMDSSDTVEEFTVELQVLWWKAVSSTASGAPDIT
jgi:hypothetical protein